MQASDVLSGAKYDWMQIALHVTASGRELRMNNSKEAMIKLVKARVKNAKHTAQNQMSIDIYSDGALPNQINGLKALITTNGTGMVGGIDASTAEFWKNQYVEYTGTVGKDTIKGQMNLLWLKVVRGDDQPDLIVSSHDLYAFYEASLQDLQRYGSADSATAGFEALRYKSAAVIFDDNANFGTAIETMYFLNETKRPTLH